MLQNPEVLQDVDGSMHGPLLKEEPAIISHFAATACRQQPLLLTVVFALQQYKSLMQICPTPWIRISPVG